MVLSNREHDVKLRSGVQRISSTSIAAQDGIYVAKEIRKSTCASILSRLEKSRCPPKCFREGDGIPLITGVDRVIYGTQPAAEVVTILGVRPPRYPFYMVSGFLCDLIQFVVDVCLHVFLHLEDPSFCWALGFGISIFFRHTSHRYLVFGDYVGGYWKSLGRMYAGYSIIIVISTVFNIVMTRRAKLPHYIAWVITLLWTGIVNYFILKKIWTFGKKETTEPSKDEVSVEDPEKAHSDNKTLDAASS
jgi:putative flippase GtrA